MPVVIGMRLTRWQPPPRRCQRLAHHILQAVGEAEALLSLEIVGDDRMRRLNRTFRHRDKTTDVLAFATQRRAWAALGSAWGRRHFLAASHSSSSSVINRVSTMNWWYS